MTSWLCLWAETSWDTRRDESTGATRNANGKYWKCCFDVNLIGLSAVTSAWESLFQALISLNAGPYPALRFSPEGVHREAKKGVFQDNRGTKIEVLSEVAIFHLIFWPSGTKSHSTSDKHEGSSVKNVLSLRTELCSGGDYWLVPDARRVIWRTWEINKLKLKWGKLGKKSPFGNCTALMFFKAQK